MVGLGLRLEMRPAEGISPEASINLTPREEQVLAVMASGAANEQIATELALSRYTVKQHR